MSTNRYGGAAGWVAGDVFSPLGEPIKSMQALPATGLGFGAGMAMMPLGGGDDKNRETDGGGILHEALGAAGRRAGVRSPGRSADEGARDGAGHGPGPW